MKHHHISFIIPRSVNLQNLKLVKSFEGVRPHRGEVIVTEVAGKILSSDTCQIFVRYSLPRLLGKNIIIRYLWQGLKYDIMVCQPKNPLLYISIVVSQVFSRSGQFVLWRAMTCWIVWIFSKYAYKIQNTKYKIQIRRSFFSSLLLGAIVLIGMKYEL